MTDDVCTCGGQITKITPNNRVFKPKHRRNSPLIRKPPIGELHTLHMALYRQKSRKMLQILQTIHYPLAHSVYAAGPDLDEMSRR